MKIASIMRPAIIFPFLLSILILGLRFERDAFELGKHGNTAAAIHASVEHSTAENFFHGYYTKEADERGTTRFVFLERRPPPFFLMSRVFFSAFNASPTGKITLGQLIMDLVVIAALSALFFTLLRLGVGPAASAGACLLTASGHYCVVYKDMFNVDQPALLGVILIFFAAARHRTKGRWPIYLTAVLAASFGMGFAAIGAALAWCAAAALTPGRKRTLSAALESPPFLTLGVSVATGLAWILYSSLTEMQLYGLQFGQTAMVEGFTRRVLGWQIIDPGLPPLHEWGYFLPLFFARIAFGLVPYGLLPARFWSPYERDYTILLCGAAAGLYAVRLAVKYIRSCPPESRELLWALFLAGPVWLLIVRNATAYHEYFALYLMGTWAICWLALLSRLREFNSACVLAGVFMLAFALAKNKADIREALHADREVTADILSASAAVSGQPLIHPEEGMPVLIPGGSWLPAYFFRDAVFSSSDAAPFVLSRRRNSCETNLTPGNKQIFLQKCGD